jgi:hypothetical protein
MKKTMMAMAPALMSRVRWRRKEKTWQAVVLAVAYMETTKQTQRAKRETQRLIRNTPVSVERSLGREGGREIKNKMST